MSELTTTSNNPNLFNLVKFPNGNEDRLAIIQTAPEGKPAKVIVAGKLEAEALFKDAVDTANAMMESGKAANIKMIDEHPAIIKAKADDLVISLNPALRKAAKLGQVIPSQAEDKKQEKQYRFDRADIPEKIVSVIKGKLGDKAQVVPPLVGGKYKGSVLYEDGQFVAQGVFRKNEHGYSMQNAVVHKKPDLEFLSDNHKWRAENKRLGGVELHVVYSDKDKSAKVYPYSLKKELGEKAIKHMGGDIKNLSPQARESLLQANNIATPPVIKPVQKTKEHTSQER